MEIFTNRNFTLLFMGRIISNIGDSLYAVAAMWLVYDLGGSTFYTGLAGVLSILPRIIQLLSGPLIERFSLKGILVYTQLLQTILLLIVPLASAFDVLTVGLVLTITPILTTLNMWVYPAQMSALPKILEKHQLTQGNSLFSVAYQGIDVACNAVSGVLIVMLGPVSLYLWNSLIFLIGAVLFMQLNMRANMIGTTRSSDITYLKDISSITCEKNKYQKYVSNIKEGLRIILATPLARLLFGIIVINAAGGATFTVMPAVATTLGGSGIYGMLLMAQAGGSMLGAILAPYMKLENVRLGHLFSGAFLLSGTLWFLSMFGNWNWLVIFLYGLAWFPGGATNVIINTVVQRSVPEKNIGTVFAASSALSGIAMPIGSFIGGSLGVVALSSTVIIGCGFAVLCVGLYWLFDPVAKSLPAAQNMNESWLYPYLSR